jgi:predicted Zn-dependent peptidase
MSSVATPVTAPALTETLKELDRIRELASKSEVEMAQRFLGLSVPAEFETGREVAATWAHALDMGYTESDVTGFMQRAADVNAEDVQKAAREYVPATPRLVLVGDRATIEKPLQDANLGPIVAWTIDELLGAKSE